MHHLHLADEHLRNRERKRLTKDLTATGMEYKESEAGTPNLAKVFCFLSCDELLAPVGTVQRGPSYRAGTLWLCLGAVLRGVSLGRWGQLESDCVLSAPLRSCQGKRGYLSTVSSIPLSSPTAWLAMEGCLHELEYFKPPNLANPPPRITVGHAYLEDHVDKFSEAEVGL